VALGPWRSLFGMHPVRVQTFGTVSVRCAVRAIGFDLREGARGGRNLATGSGGCKRPVAQTSHHRRGA